MTVGLLSFGAAPSVFNGGRSQVNLNFPYLEEYPFMNFIKAGSGWVNNDNTIGGPDPTTLDANGYPTSIAHTGVRTTFIIPTPAMTGLSGNLVLITTGTGTVKVFGTGPIAVSGVNTQHVIPEVPTTTSIDFAITATDATTPITSAALVFQEDVTDYLAAKAKGLEPFNKKFIARLVQGNFGVIRFLTWGQGLGNVTKWAHRKPQGYVFYWGSEFRGSLYVGQATNGTGSTVNDYTAPIGKQSTAVDKEPIHVLWGQDYNATSPNPVVSPSFTNGSSHIGWPAHGLSVNDPVAFQSFVGTVNPFSQGSNYYVVSVVDANTITVSETIGGTAVVAAQTATMTIALRQPRFSLDGINYYPIKTTAGNSLTGSSVADSPQSGRTATLVFDAEFQEWLSEGGNKNQSNVGIDNCVPPEVMLQLCNQVGAHPWFVLPFLATTSGVYPNNVPTDYMFNLATYVKANSPSWMIPRYEGINENWNTLFAGTSYSNFKAYAWWGINPNGGAGLQDYQGKVISQLGQIVNGVYGGPVDGTKYWMINGVQQAGAPAAYTNRMSSPKYVADMGGNTAYAAYNWVTHAAPANYVGPGLGMAALSRAAYLYSTGDTTQLATYCDSTLTANAPASGPIPTKVATFQDWYNWAQGNSPYTKWGGTKSIRLTAYEGWWTPAVPTTLSPITSTGSNSSSPISAATAANPVVVTMPTTTTGNASGVTYSTGPNTGNGAAVGMAIRVISALGGTFTNLNSVAGTVTFSNDGSNTVLWANTLVANEAVIFTTGGILPTVITLNQPYYVVNPTSTTFQISATRGGSPIAINTTGQVGTHTATTAWFVTGVGGALGTNNVSLDVDGSAFTGSYTANSATGIYVNDGINVRILANDSLTKYAPLGDYLAGPASTSFFKQLVALGVEFPSVFTLGGSTSPFDVLYPNIYIADPPTWTSLVAYNN